MKMEVKVGSKMRLESKLELTRNVSFGWAKKHEMKSKIW